MAFDGIITRAAVRELSDVLAGGRIDKIYEPEPDSIVLNIKTTRRAGSVQSGRDDRTDNAPADISGDAGASQSDVFGYGGAVRLFASCHSAGASVRLIKTNPENPKEPYPFCMLLRKHIQGSKIVSIEQRGAERIIEFTVERLNELGLMVRKKLIFEIMGKYSNIILVDTTRRSAKPGHPGLADPSSEQDGSAGCMILGSIKGVPSGLSRVREILPGRLYEYPPVQDKIPFDMASAADLAFGRPIYMSGNYDAAPTIISEGGNAAQKASPEGYDAAQKVSSAKMILNGIGGISPAVAEELSLRGSGEERKVLIDETLAEIDSLSFTPRVYEDESGVPREFHIMRLSGYESLREIEFESLSECMDYYYEHREQTSRITQRQNEILRPVQAALDKLNLKRQRLLEDLLRAEDSDKLRLYGELLTANIGSIRPGAKEVTVTNYYDGQPVTIPLDPRWSAPKNAQSYYKRYAKSKTAVKEKNRQLEDTGEGIEYLESCASFIENAGSIAELETLKNELEETGYIKRRRAQGKRPPKFKASPREYETTDGFTVLVGRNNRENDVLTLEIAARGDYWLHTKDIPGSHVILRSEGRPVSETAIIEAARLAALYSKAKSSENVPVDYVPVKYVKKPSGAKPGKVIFTHNKTLFVDPGEPGASAVSENKKIR